MPLPLAALLALGFGAEGVSRFQANQKAEAETANQDTAIGNFVNQLPQEQQGIYGAGLDVAQAFGSDPQELINNLLKNQLPQTQNEQVSSQISQQNADLGVERLDFDRQKEQESIRQFEKTQQTKLLEIGATRDANSQKVVADQVDLFGKIANLANTIGDDARPVINQFSELTNKFEILRSSLVREDGASAVSSLFSFISFLDPGSVVKEGEVALLTSESGLPAQLVGRINKLVGSGGSLADPSIRKDLARAVNDIYRSRIKTYERDIEAYRARIDSAQQSIPTNAAANTDLESLSGLEGLLNTPGFNPIAVGADGGGADPQSLIQQELERRGLN